VQVSSITATLAEFIDLVFPPPRSFAVRLPDGAIIAAGREPALFTLVLRSPGSLRRMFRPPVELSLGEAYLRRDFEIEGPLVDAFALAPTAREALRSPGAVLRAARLWRRLPRDAGEGALPVREPVHLSGGLHERDRDQAAIQYHYDVGNDFYQLFLDRRMIYSCAYFPTGAETIDEAQEAKLELICRKLRLTEGVRLLDIGCGWGGLLVYAAQRFGVSGLGVTLSEAQHRLATERVREAGLEERIRIELRDYRDITKESFDRIVSVGMFEHVGRTGKHQYFSHAFRLLRPGGLFLNHAISNRPSAHHGPAVRALENAFVGNYQFRTRYVFPDGELMPVSEANLEAEANGFEVRDVEDLREHYALTLRHWLERLRAGREEAVRLSGEPMFRLWEMYLAGSIYHFETAQIFIHQSLLARPRGDGTVDAPTTRTDLYRRPLRAGEPHARVARGAEPA
jgi:cyclopropane-fatty-acyl-phospholipid synthase